MAPRASGHRGNVEWTAELRAWQDMTSLTSAGRGIVEAAVVAVMLFVFSACFRGNCITVRITVALEAVLLD